jgi:GntR family transcriptional regulator
MRGRGQQRSPGAADREAVTAAPSAAPSAGDAVGPGTIGDLNELSARAFAFLEAASRAGHAIPKSIAIEQTLRARLKQAAAGTPVPSETVLSQQFDTSRTTIRQVATRLTEEGLIYHAPGRGTYVAAPPLHRPAGSLLSLTEEIRRRGLVPSARLVESTMTTLDVQDREAFGTDADGQHEIVLLRRVRFADGVPLAVDTVRLPGRFRWILDQPVEQLGLYAVLTPAGHLPSRATGSIRAVRAGVEDARLLFVPKGAPLLVERRTVLDQDGRPLHHGERRYAGDRYLIEVSPVAHVAEGSTDPPR